VLAPGRGHRSGEGMLVGPWRAALLERSVMGGAGPACYRIVRYYRNRDFCVFFHALPGKTLSRASNTGRACGESTKNWAVLTGVGSPHPAFAWRNPGPRVSFRTGMRASALAGIGTALPVIRAVAGLDSAPVSRRGALRQADAREQPLGRLFRIWDAAFAERADHGCQHVGRSGNEGGVGTLGELVEQPWR
jgi:hypothetical protein